jgi:N-acyl homoserine lactone hydrolase
VLIEHPTQGLVLFNTGLKSKRGDPASPGGWLGTLLQTEVLPGKSLTAQMHDAGFKPEAVRWIVLSTMRSDHTGEVERFPNARVVVTKAEQEYARQAPNGYDSGDFDDIANWKFIDFTDAKPLATFAAHVDLFGDGSCALLDVNGSTPGTVALLIRQRQRPLLLADDMAAVRENLRYAAKPGSAYDLAQWWDHIWRVKKFMDLVPELIVLPGHDLGAIEGLGSKDVVLHPFSSPTESHATPTPGPLQRFLPLK